MTIAALTWSMTWEYNDGGRSDAGFKGSTGDCVTRAIAIAAERDYQTVYDELNYEISMTLDASKNSSSRTGVPRKVYEPYLGLLGFKWVPMMKVGSGCTMHLHSDELPSGMIIARVSRHLCAVHDGVILDTHDPSRGGTRCVYGYFTRDEVL
jgi:hypothetical protein